MKYRYSFLTVAWLILGCVLLAAPRVAAEDYNVNAIVPYDLPTQAATIDAPVAGSTVQNAQQTVSGTCQVLSPVAAISLWRDGQVLGSTGCVNGTYSLLVTLAVGQNNLVARTANGNGVYGPDSASVSVTLTQPVVVQPLPPAVNQPTNPAQQTGATNIGGVVGLTLTTQDPFSVLKTDATTATIRVVVGGGEQPYVLQLNWGDGSTESRAITQPGTYEFTHTYRTARGYTVYIRVRDVKGAYTEYVYAVLTTAVDTNSTGTKKTTTGSVAEKLPGKTVQKDSHWVYLYYLCLLIFIIFLAASTYRLGYRRAKKRYLAEAEEARAATRQPTGKKQ